MQLKKIESIVVIAIVLNIEKNVLGGGDFGIVLNTLEPKLLQLTKGFEELV